MEGDINGECSIKKNTGQSVKTAPSIRGYTGQSVKTAPLHQRVHLPTLVNPNCSQLFWVYLDKTKRAAGARRGGGRFSRPSRA